jgi:hypothetical protein
MGHGERGKRICRSIGFAERLAGRFPRIFFTCILQVNIRDSDLQNASYNQNMERITIMSNAVVSHPYRLNASAALHTRALVTTLLVAWLALAFWLGASGFFATPPAAPPLHLLLGVLIPIGLFLTAFWTWQSFHDFVLAADLPLLTGTQAWRFSGFGFLTLNTLGLLPAYFAWPAALGDMMVGLTAPWLVTALLRQPCFAGSRAFVAWNIFGILDFVVALSMGAIVPRLFPELARSITMAPMAHLPLVLIPTFLVPMFTILHLVALFQARKVSATRQQDD